MRNFHKNLMLEGAGGPDALQTSPRMGGDDTGAESSDFCRTRTGGGDGMRNFHKNLMLEGGWRAGRPPDLLAREKTKPD